MYEIQGSNETASEPVVQDEEELVLDSKGNAVKQAPKAPAPKLDLKANIKSEFANANNEVNTKIGKPTEVDQKPDDIEPKSPEKKKYKIKYEGKEEEVEVDDQAIIDALQKSRDYTKKTQQAAEANRKAQSVFDLLDNMKKDPNSLFDFANQYLGHDVEKIAEQRLLEKYKYELMPEHERQAYDLTKENKQLKMELDKRTQADKASEEQAAAEAKALQEEKDEEKAIQDIGDFFDSKGIEPSNDNLIDVLQMMLRYVDTPNPLTVEQAWNKVHGREQSKRESILKTLKPEDLTDEIKKALRQADVDRIKTNKPWQNSPKREQATPKVEGRKAVTSEEYFKEIEKSFKN